MINAIKFLLKEKPCIYSQATKRSVMLGPVTSESESGSVQTSDHAVEDGSTVTDNVVKSPDTIDIAAFLSDRNDAAVKAGALAGRLSQGSMSVNDKLALLREWMDRGELVTYSGPVFSGFITSGYDITADDMLITKINVSRNSGTGSGVEVSIGLKKVTIARSLSGEQGLPKAARSLKNKGLALKGKLKTGFL